MYESTAGLLPATNRTRFAGSFCVFSSRQYLESDNRFIFSVRFLCDVFR